MSSIAQILIDKWEGNTPPPPPTVSKEPPVDLTPLRDAYRNKLEHGTWVVEFYKKDGTPAVMECTLDENIMPAQKEGTVSRPEQNHLLHVYSLDRQGWRSFLVANVKVMYKKPDDGL